MTRFTLTLVLLLSISVVFALPAAADPKVSKSVLTTADGTTVVILSISASGKDIYGISISDASGSIEDISVPDGWAGVASNDRIVFRTSDKPIASGRSNTFRIVTKKADAGLNVTFSDKKTAFAAESI